MRASSLRVAAPAGRAWAARLPFMVELGPYRLSVEFREPAQMVDRRRLSCVNIEENRIELRQDLRGMRLAENFFACVIRLIHFSKGCQQGCVEEAYAHSLATGMVEFAQRNPGAWLWFNLLLSKHLPGDARYHRYLRGAASPVAPMPRHVLVAGQPVALRIISRTAAGSAFGWYDYGRREVQLCVGLAGANLSIVALHEINHAVHHAYALETSDSHRNFQRWQLRGWLGIMRDDPNAWRWLIWTIGLAEG